jgi:hypothetical protein
MIYHLRVSTIAAVLSLGLFGCAGKILQFERAEEVLKVDEFEKKVEIKEAPVPPPPQPEIKEIPAAKETKVAETKPEIKKPVKEKGPKKKKQKELEKPKVAGPRQPEIEDREGFNDLRRPIVDPFRVGEKVTFNVSYFNIVAGTITIEVKPMAEVNGLKSYHFEVSGRTNSFFSKIYEVDDKVTTYMSYDDLTPLNLQISIKESKQLAETRTFFDWKTMKASYWQKRITKENGETSKKLDWDLLPYSQNVVSAAYYMRVFKYDLGKKLAFRVADEGKNIIFSGQVLRKEKLETEAGTFDTIVVRPDIKVDGEFKPVGDILIWLTDDDRKFLVRIESKIKIGTLVAKLKSIEKGQE